ncbi:MAG: HAD-IA family hydrolase [Betaproteobacteria bacterium]|nr:HAD-IA family hydrolase [Betaproteobacteria bacterium]
MSDPVGAPQAEALILDFGSVVTLTLFETHRLSERELGLPANTLTWMGPFDPLADTLWASMQRDEISEREYWLQRTKEVGALLGEEWSEIVQFVSRTRGRNPAEIVRPEIPTLIFAAKAAGRKLAILSNELDLFYGRSIRTELGFLGDFDVINDATYTGVLKPDRQAYDACVSQLGLAANECVFIDDQIRNVIGGRNAGLQALHLDVKNPQAAFNAALERLGIDMRFAEATNKQRASG